MQSPAFDPALRAGMKDKIKSALERAAGITWKPPAGETIPPVCDEHVAALERAAYNHSVRAMRATPGLTHRTEYVSAIRGLIHGLGRQIGPCPDETVAITFLRKTLTAAQAVEHGTGEDPDPDPRETVRRMFILNLMAADASFHDRARALKLAHAIEVSCYNAAVRISKESEDPPRRQWDSAAFVDIYGTRCGTISSMLDPDSSSCIAYGPTLVPKLLDGTIKPEALGDMTSEALCPQATAAERADIAKRATQRVETKESTLFRCPHCGERRCSYQQVQRRSLDESPDYLCMCLSCNRRFNGRS